MSKARFRPSSAAKSVEIELSAVGHDAPGQFIVRCEDVETEVEVNTDVAGEGWLSLGNRVVRFFSARIENAIHVWAGGRTHRFEIVDTAPRRGTSGAAAAATDELKAPMPGTVLEIKLAAGERFTAHQPIIVLESMKMEMSLGVPVDGRVKEFLCEKGELVSMGAVLARVEPDEP